VVSRNWQPYYSSERSYKGGLYAGDPPFDATGNPLQRGQLGSSTFNTTGIDQHWPPEHGIGWLRYIPAAPERLNYSRNGMGAPQSASGSTASHLGSIATGFLTYSWNERSRRADIQLRSVRESRTGIHAKQAVFDTSVVAASVVGTAGIGPAATVLWTSGSGAPSGACVNGSMYTSTTGTTVNILWACGSTAWQLVK